MDAIAIRAELQIKAWYAKNGNNVTPSDTTD